MDVVLCVSGVLCELWLLFFSQLTQYFKGLKELRANEMFKNAFYVDMF